jgi:K+-transporting ATPase ATPase A chain
MVKDRSRGGWCSPRWFLWLGAVAARHRHGGDRTATPSSPRRAPTSRSPRPTPAATWRARRSASAPAACGLFSASTTGTSTGAVNCAHDSMTPLGGMAPLANMMLGEVSPGGTGAGLYGMLVFALLAVFIAGLMVGRTPEYLGKKIQAAEMKLVVLYILVSRSPCWVRRRLGGLLQRLKASILNPAPRAHRGALRLHLGGQQQRLRLRRAHRQHRLVQHHARPRDADRPLPADRPGAGHRRSLVRKQRVPVTAGTFPTGTPLFAGLLTGVC